MNTPTKILSQIWVDFWAHKLAKYEVKIRPIYNKFVLAITFSGEWRFKWNCLSICTCLYILYLLQFLCKFSQPSLTSLHCHLLICLFNGIISHLLNIQSFSFLVLLSSLYSSSCGIPCYIFQVGSQITQEKIGEKGMLSRRRWTSSFGYQRFAATLSWFHRETFSISCTFLFLEQSPKFCISQVLKEIKSSNVVR